MVQSKKGTQIARGPKQRPPIDSRRSRGSSQLWHDFRQFQRICHSGGWQRQLSINWEAKFFAETRSGELCGHYSHKCHLRWSRQGYKTQQKKLLFSWRTPFRATPKLLPSQLSVPVSSRLRSKPDGIQMYPLVFTSFRWTFEDVRPLGNSKFHQIFWDGTGWSMFRLFTRLYFYHLQYRSQFGPIFQVWSY